jgi:pimeloyl-ACP methyl ester carboxylesterase
MYQMLARLPGTGAVIGRLLGSPTFRRSSLGFGGCFHDPSRIEGEFRARFVDPLIASEARMDGAMRFLRRMKFTRLDEFATLHRELSMPTLFVWGADDPTFPEPTARKMMPQFRNVAGFHTIPNAKLFVYEEHPDEVAAQIGRFVGRM